MTKDRSLADFVKGQLPADLVSSLEKGITASIPYANFMGFSRIKIEGLLSSLPEYIPLFELMQQGYDEVYSFTSIKKQKDTECLDLGLIRSPDKNNYFILFFEGLKGLYETRKIEEIMRLDLANGKIRETPAHKEERDGTYYLANSY